MDMGDGSNSIYYITLPIETRATMKNDETQKSEERSECGTETKCSHAGRPWKILVLQQHGSAESKIEGIRKYGDGLFALEVVSIDEPLPAVIDDGAEYLPSDIRADLVLDYLTHLDLSEDLANMCLERNIPVVARGKKLRVKGTFTPVTCCALPRHECLGLYGEWFGAPEFALEMTQGRLTAIRVVRGAPCGATWKAAERLIGLSFAEAVERIGLETQFCCTANPAGWDPMYGKSPVHFAAEVHKAAFIKALESAVRCDE